MSSASDLRFLVLHGLRLKGFGGRGGDRGGRRAVRGGGEARARRAPRRGAGHLPRRPDLRLRAHAGRPARPGPAARRAARRHRAVPRHLAAYERFLAMNKGAAAALHGLADVDETVNDHTDPAYDAAVIARLGTLHDEVQPVLAELDGRPGPLRRLPAPPRVQRSRSRAAGDGDWFTKPHDRLVPHRLVRAARGPARPRSASSVGARHGSSVSADGALRTR